MIEDENKEIKKEEAKQNSSFNPQKQAAEIEATAKLPGPTELEPATTMPPQAVEDMEGFSSIGENSLERNLYQLEQQAGISSRDWTANSDIRNIKFTQALEKSSFNPIQKAELLSQFSEDVKKSGGKPPSISPEQVFNTAQKQAAQRFNYSASRRLEEQFNDLTDIIQEDPAAGAAALDSYTADLSKSLAAAGHSPEQIEIKVEQYRRNAVNMAVDSFAETDPTAARNYLSQNKDNLSPSDYRKAENRIARTEKAIESAQKQQLFEAIKPGVMSLNVEEIAEIGKLDTPAGEVAREFSRKLENDPIKAVEKDLSPLSIKDSASMATRVAEIAEIEERLSTPNRPVEIPYLTAGNIKNIVNKVQEGEGSNVLNTLSNVLVEDRAKIADQLRKNDNTAPLAFALDVMEVDKTLANMILEGMRSPNSSRAPKEVLGEISPYADPTANRALRETIKTLSKLDNGMNSEEIKQRVLNEQSLGTFYSTVPVPRGTNVDAFRDALRNLFESPEEQKKIFSGEPLNGYGEFEFTDIDLVPFKPGEYYIMKNGKTMADKNGNPIKVIYGRMNEI